MDQNLREALRKLKLEGVTQENLSKLIAEGSRAGLYLDQIAELLRNEKLIASLVFYEASWSDSTPLVSRINNVLCSDGQRRTFIPDRYYFGIADHVKGKITAGKKKIPGIVNHYYLVADEYSAIGDWKFTASDKAKNKHLVGD